MLWCSENNFNCCSRILEILDKETLENISRYYRNMIPAMNKRVITPYFTQVAEEEIAVVANSSSVAWPYSDGIFYLFIPIDDTNTY